jgi:hypothetical protein
VVVDRQGETEQAQPPPPAPTISTLGGAASIAHCARHAGSSVQLDPSGHLTPKHGSSMHVPPQHAFRFPQSSFRHRFSTQLPAPFATTHTSFARQLSPAHGSPWHVPATHACPGGHISGHGSTQPPAAGLQYCPVGQFTS